MNAPETLTKDALRGLIAEQWDRIVRAGSTGDENAVEWLTEAIWTSLHAEER